MEKMQTYISIDVPLRRATNWYTCLKRTLGTICNDIYWQESHPHLTLAFMSEPPSEAEVRHVVSTCLEPYQKQPIERIPFDKLDVFLTNAGDRYIVNLTTTHIPESFQALINDLRSSLKECGAVITTDFRFHVTLCEIKATTIDINTIRELLESVMLPSFSLPLTRLKYRSFRPGKTIQEWPLSRS